MQLALWSASGLLTSCGVFVAPELRKILLLGVSIRLWLGSLATSLAARAPVMGGGYP